MRIMFTFMFITAFLSMWISNTATTAMMIPIVSAVAQTMDQHEEEEMDDMREGNDRNKRELSKRGFVRRQELLLSVAYAANVGGTAVVTGSPPNLVLPNVL